MPARPPSAQQAEASRRRRFRMTMAWLAAMAAVVAATLFGWRAWHEFFHIAAPLESSVPLLDPARIVVVRTPGGMLEVARLQRTEEFAWQSAFTCRFIDCSVIARPTTSRARVTAHYVWRVPLAAQWTLQPRGDHYLLQVPPLQLQEPVAFDTATMELSTDPGGLLSPSKLHNRERLLRELGPELAQRGQQASYLDAQRPEAGKTVAEFARKWMIEQGQRADLPIRVEFESPPPAP